MSTYLCYCMLLLLLLLCLSTPLGAQSGQYVCVCVAIVHVLFFFLLVLSELCFNGLHCSVCIPIWLSLLALVTIGLCRASCVWLALLFLFLSSLSFFTFLYGLGCV